MLLKLKILLLILGITFKENMSDIRNSKVIDIYNILNMNGLKIDVYDPHADKEEVKSVFKIEMVENPQKYDSIIIAVAHDEFKKLNFKSLKSLIILLYTILKVF